MGDIEPVNLYEETMRALEKKAATAMESANIIFGDIVRQCRQASQNGEFKSCVEISALSQETKSALVTALNARIHPKPRIEFSCDQRDRPATYYIELDWSRTE